MGGKVTCTLGEVKQRADFIIYWGGNPAECHPRHFTKYTIMQKSKFLPRGRKDRELLMIEADLLRAELERREDAGTEAQAGLRRAERLQIAVQRAARVEKLVLSTAVEIQRG